MPQGRGLIECGGWGGRAMNRSCVRPRAALLCCRGAGCRVPFFCGTRSAGASFSCSPRWGGRCSGPPPRLVVGHRAARLGQRGWCQTHAFPLAGTPHGPWPAFLERKRAELTQRLDVDAATAAHLVQRYGWRVDEVTEYLRRPGGLELVVAGERELRGEF